MKSVYLREQRDKEIFRIYSEALSSGRFRSGPAIFDFVRKHPAPRFYVSSYFISRALYSIMRGDALDVKGQNAVRKFNDLYKLFLKLRATEEYKSYSVQRISEVLEKCPAPEFYISARTTRLIISQQKRLQWERMQRKYSR